MTENNQMFTAVLITSVIVIIVVFMTACSPINKYFGLADDNFVEELAEAAVYIETGLNLDFTPNSPEK